MRKKLYLAIILLLVCFLLNPHAFAATGQEIPIIGEYELPEEYQIKIQDTCSGHGYFYNVTVRPDGWFAIVSRVAAQKQDGEGYLSRVYIDIYDELGTFQKELSIKTNENVVVVLAEQSVDVFFYNHLISMDLQTGEIESSKIRAGYVDSSGMREEFNRHEFEVNGWEYRCVNSFSGYTSLIRTKDGVSEELVSFSGNIPGADISFGQAMLIGFCNGIFLIILVPRLISAIIKHRKKKLHNET